MSVNRNQVLRDAHLPLKRLNSVLSVLNYLFAVLLGAQLELCRGFLQSGQSAAGDARVLVDFTPRGVCRRALRHVLGVHSLQLLSFSRGHFTSGGQRIGAQSGRNLSEFEGSHALLGLGPLRF